MRARPTRRPSAPTSRCSTDYGMAVILSLTGLDAPDGLNVAPMADVPTRRILVFGRHRLQGRSRGHFRPLQRAQRIDWSCWLNGCHGIDLLTVLRAIGYAGVGHAIRTVGATQPIMLGGLDYSSDETSWAPISRTIPNTSLDSEFPHV